MNVTIVYFSSSGKTKRMAEMLAAQLRRNVRVLLTSLDEARESDFREAELILVGSPAWTGEQVVPAVAEFVTGSCSSDSCRKVAFFGSYDWGEGNFLDGLIEKLKAKGVAVHPERLLWPVNDGELAEERVAGFLAGLMPQSAASSSK